MHQYSTSSRATNTSPLSPFIIEGLYNLPTPASLSYFWNFGSCLGLLHALQILTGLFLVMHYSADVNLAFDSVSHISRDVWYGWLLRSVHATGASFFFFCVYTHIGRGIYYGGYLNLGLWTVGFVILVVLMAISFLGYVLPWGQISFWGATVITNLLSSLPYFGTDLVHWVWGGFSVADATLKRFLALHFLLPLLLIALVGLHLLLLHTKGRRSPLGISTETDNIPFHSLYTIKDVHGFILLLSLFVFTAFFFPSIFSEPDNYIPANPISTPAHIIPEWYFLYAYAILRTISSKLGGVIVMFSRLLVLLTLYFTHNQKIVRLAFYGPVKALFWCFVGCFVALIWLGSCPVVMPYVTLRRAFSLYYFIFFVLLPVSRLAWDKILRIC